MLGYIFKRLVYMIPTLFGMSLISFLIIQLPPGDYLSSMIATMSDSGQAVDPDEIERLKQIYGFDDPFYIQYVKWIWGIISRGDFGYGKGGRIEHMNHVEPSIRTAFAYMGITDVESVAIEYDEFGGERLQGSIARAEAEVDALVDRLLAARGRLRRSA